MMDSFLFFMGMTLPILLALYFGANILYEANLKMHRETSVVSKLLGFNLKHIDDRAAWVRHYRISLILFGAVVTIMIALLARHI